MGYQDHDFSVTDDEDQGALGILRAAISLGVRLLGVALVLVGLWGALQVILEGWALYREPARIERIASAVEQGSHLDAVFSIPAPERVAPAVATIAGDGTQPAAPGGPGAAAESASENPVGAGGAPLRPAGSRSTLRLSYFAAWFIALLLLAVIGALSTAAFAAGGRLALGGEGLREVHRSLAREIRGLRRKA